MGWTAGKCALSACAMALTVGAVGIARADMWDSERKEAEGII